jgi:hypothetical protein
MASNFVVPNPFERLSLMHLGSGVMRVYEQRRPCTFERTCAVFKRQLRIRPPSATLI